MTDSAKADDTRMTGEKASGAPWVRWALAVALGALPRPALAQDVPGIELCTREAGMDRRTSCLQSNVEFLQKVITKNALDSQQKLAVAAREIAALRDQAAAANRESAVLREKLATLEARLARLEKPAAKPDTKLEK